MTDPELCIKNRSNCLRHLNWHFFRSPFLSRRPAFVLPDPSVDPDWFGELRYRYPGSTTTSSAHFAHFFSAKSAYITILNELAHKSFGDESTLSIHEAILYARRLMTWFQSLPAVLTPKRVVLPAHFLLQ
jgi:hypothetical protein